MATGEAGNALAQYGDDGSIEIDNNAAEHALRSVALGRKNYCFPAPTAAANAARRCTR
jgi:transposase